MRSSENKELLCIVPDLSWNNCAYYIYVDGYWRHSSWAEDDFSEWKIMYHPKDHIPTFWYKHRGSSRFITDEGPLISEIDRLLVENIQAELFLRELLTDESEAKA